MHSVKEEYSLEFNILQEAIDTIPHRTRFYIPKKHEHWLRENCEEDCYLVSQGKWDYMEHYYLAMFIDSNDAFLYKLVWG